ncbi:MAG TPA: hypothetical protein VGE57_14545 [Solimonas sp.]
MKMHAIFLSQHGFLRLQGADTQTFLQGQLSSDLRLLTAAQGQLSSYNTPKGRVLALPQLFMNADGSILMELPAGLVEPTLKRLRMFVLRSKVTVEAPGAQLQALGLVGDGVAAWLTSQSLPAPEAPLASASTADGLLVARRLGEPPRYSLTGAPHQIERLSRSLPAGTLTDDPLRWRRADIDSGVPVVYPETRELFIPQMLNLDLLGGIGFDKGCYTGQEIVARLHYLGQVKRRLFVAHIAGPCPPPGASVITDDGQAAGEIVDAVPGEYGSSNAAGALATVVVQLSQRQARLQLSDGGAAVQLLRGPDA